MLPANEARLEAQRASHEPCCANCNMWGGRRTGHGVDLCEEHQIKTLDLSVCSKWRAYWVHEGEIITGDITGD